MNTRAIAREILGLVVRLVGLCFLYQGLSSVPVAIASICGGFPHFYPRNIFPGLIAVGWPSLVAYWLVRGAPPLMRLAYPPTADEKATAGVASAK